MTNNDFERDAIRNVQEYLRHLSFHDERIGTQGGVPIDGIWNTATRDALMKFQQSRGLRTTGTVDRATWEVLKAEYDRSVAQNSPPATLALFPRYPNGFVLKSGDTGFLVTAVQYILGELERLYSFPEITISNVYDDATAAIIRDFQRRNGIEVTGEVGRETWDALAVQHNLLLEYEE